MDTEVYDRCNEFGFTQGLMADYTSGNLRPDDLVIREQMAAVL